ncbi:MAG: LytTR family DNA-binding domain-containing protein [Bacteroidota bacterium]
MKSLRVLIVDDELLARRGVRARLERAGNVHVVAEAGSGREAIGLIQQHAETEAPIDVVFLDVQMPGVDGFGVVEAVGAARMPVTVFVTAYDQHALRAFEAEALDYLLKPIHDGRFEAALARARSRVAERRESALGRRVADVLSDPPAARLASPPVPTDTRFLVERGGRVAVVHADDIVWVEAAGDYVQLHTSSTIHLLRETMARMEKRLDPARFVRIHRSTIVRVDQVRELRPLPNREYGVVLVDGAEVRLSRSYRDRLASALGVDL